MPVQEAARFTRAAAQPGLAVPRRRGGRARCMAILRGRWWQFRNEKRRSRAATSVAPSTASPRLASASARTAAHRRGRTRCARRARRTAAARSSRSARSVR